MAPKSRGWAACQQRLLWLMFKGCVPCCLEVLSLVLLLCLLGEAHPSNLAGWTVGLHATLVFVSRRAVGLPDGWVACVWLKAPGTRVHCSIGR